MTNSFEDKILESLFNVLTEVAGLKAKVASLEERLQNVTYFPEEEEDLETTSPLEEEIIPSKRKEFYKNLSEKLEKEISK